MITIESACLVFQHRKCGRKYCTVCPNSEGHGPYYYLYKRHKGHRFSLYIGKNLPADLSPYYARLAAKCERAIAAQTVR